VTVLLIVVAKLGLPELLLLLIVAVYIASIIGAVKATNPKACFGLGLLLILLASLGGPWDIGSIVGAFIANLLFLAIIPVIYWALWGRKTDAGKLRTSKIFYWLALIIPPLVYSAGHWQTKP
jgi:hypothetical protein